MMGIQLLEMMAIVQRFFTAGNTVLWTERFMMLKKVYA